MLTQKLRLKMFKILLLLPLVWLPTISIAENAPIDPGCIESQSECQKRANKKESNRQYCLANPERCKKWRDDKRQQREKGRELRRQCKLSPAQCPELTRDFRKWKKHFHQEKIVELKQAQALWCADNPIACEQWDAELKKIQEQCQISKQQLKDKFQNRPRRM
jgi:hypothetical protein